MLFVNYVKLPVTELLTNFVDSLRGKQTKHVRLFLAIHSSVHNMCRLLLVSTLMILLS